MFDRNNVTSKSCSSENFRIVYFLLMVMERVCSAISFFFLYQISESVTPFYLHTISQLFERQHSFVPLCYVNTTSTVYHIFFIKMPEYFLSFTFSKILNYHHLASWLAENVQLCLMSFELLIISYLLIFHLAIFTISYPIQSTLALKPRTRKMGTQRTI